MSVRSSIIVENGMTVASHFSECNTDPNVKKEKLRGLNFGISSFPKSVTSKPYYLLTFTRLAF